MCFSKYADTFCRVGRLSRKNGMGDVYSKIATLPEEQQQAIHADIDACLANGPDLAMVDSDKGITNFSRT